MTEPVSDLLLRYLLTARKRDRSPWRRMLFGPETFLSAGLQDLFNGAAARVEVHSQHEMRHSVKREAPASHRHRIEFVVESRPARPLAPHFRDDRQVFALRPTLRTGACGDCSSTGTVCCRVCGAQNPADCRRCAQTGREACTRCDGEGQLAHWTDDVFTYTIESEAKTIAPVDPPVAAVETAVDQWLAHHPSTLIARFARPQAEAHLGYHSAAVSMVCQRAREHEIELLQALPERPGRCLFHRVNRHLEPVRNALFRVGDSPLRFWVVGRGDDAIEVFPPQRLSMLRLVLGAVLVATVTALPALTTPLGVQPPAVVDAFSTPLGCILWGVLLALLVAVYAAVVRRSASARAIVVLRDTPEPTPWLPCLAAVGSHVSAVQVADHTHQALMDAMVSISGRAGSAHSITLQHNAGPNIRLLERDGTKPLPPGLCRRLVREVDGIVCLAKANALGRTPSPVLPLFEDLAQHPDRRVSMHHAAWVQEPTSASPALALGSIQTAYVAGIADRAHWRAVFHALWSPIASFAPTPSVPPPTPMRFTGPDRLASPDPSFMRWLSNLFSPSTKARSKVPILGVEGSGKSSLIVTIAQYVSLHEHGHVSEHSLHLFAPMLSAVQAGRPLRTTVGYSDFEVVLRRVSERDGSLTDVDLVFSSEDIPGQDFRMLVGALAQNPELTPPSGGAASVLDRFGALLSACQGFIFVVDLLRDYSPEAFRADPLTHTWAAYSDQVKPIMTGLLLASQVNGSLANKPVFFVLSKPDLHRLGIEQLESDFRRAMAIPLAALRARGVRIRLYSVQGAGWRMDSNLEGLGVDDLIADLAHAVGAVCGAGG